MTVTKTAIVGVDDNSQSTDRPHRIRIAGLRVGSHALGRSSFIRSNKNVYI